LEDWGAGEERVKTTLGKIERDAEKGEGKAGYKGFAGEGWGRFDHDTQKRKKEGAGNWNL